MRILFISPNRLRLIAPPLPLGLASLVAAVGKEHEVWVLDFMFAPDPLEEVRRVLAKWQPELIALSLRNIDNQDYRNPITYFPENRELVTELRNLSQAPILLGGAGFSIVPRELLEYLGADWGLVGEGEGALQTFLQAFNTRDWEQVPGLVWRHGDSWRLNPPQASRRFGTVAGPGPGIFYS